MIKPKYNFLAFIQAAIGLANLVCILLLFGVSKEANGFLLSNSILSSFFLLMMMACEQFQLEYNKIKNINMDASDSYLNKFFFVGLSFGVIIYLLLMVVGIERIIHILMPGLDKTSNEIVRAYLAVLNPVLVFYIPYQICISKLNSDGKIELTYLLTMVPSIFQLGGMIAQYFFDCGMLNIIELIFAGYLVSFIIACRKSNLKLSSMYGFGYRSVFDGVIKSIKIKGIHNIHNYLTVFFVNFYISKFSSGEVTIFLYLKKIAETALQITYGPTHKIAMNMFGTALTTNNLRFIIDWRNKLDLSLSAILLAITLIMVIMVAAASNWLTSVSQNEFFIIVNLLLLMAQVLIQTLELPSAIVSLWHNDFFVFLKSNTCYILCLITLTIILQQQFGFYALPLSLAISQLINLAMIRRNSNKYLYVNA